MANTKEFHGNRIHLINCPKFYTNGDIIKGVIRYKPVFSRSTKITSVEISLCGSTDPDKNSEGDASESATHFLYIKKSLFRGETTPSQRHDFEFEFNFPFVTNVTLNSEQKWPPHNQFENRTFYPLPPSRKENDYWLAATVNRKDKEPVTYGHILEFYPSLEGKSISRANQQFTCLAASDSEPVWANFRQEPGLANELQTRTLGENEIRLELFLPVDVIAGQPISGHILVDFSPVREKLRCIYFFLELEETTGCRVRRKPDQANIRYGKDVKTRTVYHLCMKWPGRSTVKLNKGENIDVANLATPKVVPHQLQTHKTCNFFMYFEYRFRALFLTDRMVSIAIDKRLPVRVAGHVKDLA
jgi:hypothetical protein